MKSILIFVGAFNIAWAAVDVFNNNPALAVSNAVVGGFLLGLAFANRRLA
jgi:hypothetical protein